MDIKSLKRKSGSLADKLIENGNQPFKLWLEFEETYPFNDLENNFANISVNTLDGRVYGINVWTYKFLDTAKEEEAKNGKRDFIIPPDLFVRELTRDCIEKAIKELLSKGELEELLNKSIFNLNFIEPYWDVSEMKEEMIQSLLKEFKTELGKDHLLSNKSVELIGRKTNSDQILLKFDIDKIAIVHLTWTSKEENSGYPKTQIYNNKIEFWKKEMKKEISEFQE